jgi:putative sterol carrier protein
VTERLPKGNVGLHLIFDALVIGSALMRGRFTDNAGIAQTATRGAQGAYNFVFTGAGGDAWHIEIGDGTMHWHRGLHPNARATARISVDDVFRLLAGKVSFLTIQMAGKLRVEGDGHAAMIFAGLIGRVRDLRNLEGRPGRIARAYLDFALRRSGTGLSFERKNDGRQN